MSLGWNESETVRQHHRELRDVGRMNHLSKCSPRYHLSMHDSLERLAQQGYGMEDTAVMFGVSRERVRQWAEKYGLTEQFKVLGKGTKPRMWDAEQGRFVAQTWTNFRADQHGAVIETQRQTRRQRRKARRRRLVSELRALAARLGRTPVSLEVSEAMGTSWSDILTNFRGRSRWKARQHTPYRSLHRRFYRLAGLSPRPRGTPGHIERDAA